MDEAQGREAEGRRERRRAAMIEAARALFLERGYDAVSLNEIVRRSGGSLSTLYALFENKEGLLRAIVSEERFDGLERLDAIVAQGRGAAETLHAIAASIQQSLGQPEVTRLMRIVMVKSLADAAFGHAIYRNAHEPRVEWLARLFTRWAKEGEARIADPVMAAHFFLSLTLHPAQTRALYGEQEGVRALAPARCVTGAVDLFVSGYAMAPAGDAVPA